MYYHDHLRVLLQESGGEFSQEIIIKHVRTCIDWGYAEFAKDVFLPYIQDLRPPETLQKEIQESTQREL